MTKSQLQKHKYIDKRIGLLGGSFNPAHDGHVQMSLFALKRLKLDEVWWLVSPQNPLKNKDEMKSLEARYSYAQKHVAHQKKIVVKRVEEAYGTTFTHEILTALKEDFLQTKFVWLMGEDNLKTVHLWKKWHQIFLCMPIAVFRRKGYSNARLESVAEAVYAEAKLPLASAKKLVDLKPPSWMVLDNEFNPESATRIRTLKK